MISNVKANPSVQIIQATSDRSWLKFGGRQWAGMAGVLAAAACLFAGSSAHAQAPTIQSLNPSSAQARSPAFNLTIHLDAPISFFGSCAAIQVWWDGVLLAPPSCDPSDSSNVIVSVPAANLAFTTADITTLPVTVWVPSYLPANQSDPVAFTIYSSFVNPLSLQSSVVPSGGSATLQTVYYSPGSGGVVADYNHVGSGNATVTVANYATSPIPPGTVFEVGGGYYDVQIQGADPSDVMTVKFYYPSAITGFSVPSESTLVLQYYNGTTLVPVESPGGTTPITTPTINPIDDLDGTDSGGRFTVMFDFNSKPSIVGLSGTIFTFAPAPLNASPSTLWPPNHKMVPVTVNAPDCSIVSVSSNEPQTGLGNGDLATDWKITGPLTVNLRAERGNTGGGRIYTILLQCSDGSQNVAVVRVPHDKSKN